MLTVQELHAQLPEIDIEDVLSVLAADGLGTRLGDLVGATRAAVRADQLTL
jgi:hypothetical protein